MVPFVEKMGTKENLRCTADFQKINYSISVPKKLVSPLNIINKTQSTDPECTAQIPLQRSPGPCAVIKIVVSCIEISCCCMSRINERRSVK